MASTTHYRLPQRGRLRRLLTRLEPWYDWGVTDVFRLDSLTDDFSGDVVGTVYRLEIQFLGIHLGFQVGRTPRLECAA